MVSTITRVDDLSCRLCRCSENGPWDTSKALVRRTLEHCIHLGRQHRAQGRKQDEYEAYRLLGQSVSPITPPSQRVSGRLTSASSSYTPLRTSQRIRISANSLLFLWVTPMFSCMLAIMYASKPPTVDGSPLWSLERSDPVIFCIACLGVSLRYKPTHSVSHTKCRGQ